MSKEGVVGFLGKVCSDREVMGRALSLAGDEGGAAGAVGGYAAELGCDLTNPECALVAEGLAKVGPRELSAVELGAVSGGGTAGDAILESMQAMKSSRNALVEKIESILQGAQGSYGIQDLMRLQFELMQLNLQIELTTKTADKSSQGVQTLFKNQP